MTDDAATGASDRHGEPPVEEPPRQTKSLTIGAVCKGLQQEFPDISISKIRYLEDQKLLTPRRTPGGYRLYSATDVSRLRTILRLQRDEFLPLRGDPPGAGGGAHGSDETPAPRRRRTARQAAATARPGAALRRLTFSVRAGRRAVLARGRRRGDRRRAAPGRRSSRTSGSSRASCARASATTTRPSARSCAPSPSWRATASRGATCACSRPPPSARRRCCSRSSPRRCARATRSAARRPSRRWRTSPRSPRTSSTCCSCGTCGGSPR